MTVAEWIRDYNQDSIFLVSGTLLASYQSTRNKRAVVGVEAKLERLEKYLEEQYRSDWKKN
jgi:hypothetical protein